MKKTIKVGIVLLVLGVILAILGIANNGIQSVYWDQGFKIAKQRVQVYRPKQIKSITLNSDLAIIVRTGDTTKIRVASSHDKPTVTTKAGHVTITSKHASDLQTVGFHFSPVLTDATVITVPRGTVLNQLTTTSQQGDVRLSGIKVRQINLANHGNVTLNNVNTDKALTLNTNDTVRLTNVTAPSLQLTTTSADLHVTTSQFNAGQSNLTTTNGNITIRQTAFTRAQLRTTNGNVTFNDNQVTKRLHANTTNGNIHVQAPTDTGINAITSSGNLTIFNWHQTNQHQHAYRPRATTQYQLTTTSGNINVSAS
ncbi:DUF4097 family beta strand repeat-containing protein [Lactiplantibacillus daowaiensis]|uniref:DUF4097 family beta strand repeat-containing protein n=1 Tax=Lactiplantibacillus daowaiensis TaxID=2559918 RepID=A0ABW1S1E7_9LACO|nr:DUF4097 family beta strand repeat-containing protein [Lactiplantibacillus daowaiensis]